MSWVRQCVKVLLIVAITAIVEGCANKTPPPLQPPSADLRMSHFSGTPLSGPTARAVAQPKASEALAVRISLIAVENIPRGAISPLGPHANLISAAGSGQAMLPSGRLTLGTRFGTGSDAQEFVRRLNAGEFGRVAQMNQTIGALPRGVTIALTAADPFSARSVDPDDRRRFEILLCRRAMDAGSPTAPSTESIELAVALCDVPAASPELEVTPDRSDAETQHPATMPAVSPTMLEREMAIVDGLVVEDHLLIALVVPFQFATSESKATVALIEVFPSPEADADDESHVQAVARCAEDLAHSIAEAAADQSRRTVVSSADWPGYESAIAALDQPSTRRTAMAFLASQTAASICEDLTLVSDELMLEQLCLDVRAALVTHVASSSSDARTRESLGWLLDRSALQLLGRLQADDKLPPELASVLAVHAGEAGRNAASMEELTKSAASRTDLEARLVAENFIYLEDPSPAARVRAFDWLSARERAPAGYNPLSSVKERRQAIERALDDMKQADSAASATPHNQGGAP